MSAKGRWHHREELPCGVPVTETTRKERQQKDIPVIIDHKITLLAAAEAAMASECRPCLNDIMPKLEEVGVNEADLRWAMENGQLSGTNAELNAFALGLVYRMERPKERLR